MSARDSTNGTVVLNPESGTAKHADAVRKRAALMGFEVQETRAAGDAVAFARSAAERGDPVVAAAGGDGTLNEVVRGVSEADALDAVTVGVIPAGTGNNFAKNVGISTIDEGFDALDEGDRRRIDLGRANDSVFVNSCIAGLTADASAETSPELKNRFGGLAYVITTLRSAGRFEGLGLTIHVGGAGTDDPAWTGDAMLVLVGNGQRFTAQGRGQANMEDGLFDVCIIEDVSAVDLMGDAVTERLFGGETPHITRLQAPSLEITGLNPEPINFSLDGEMIRTQELSVAARPNTLRIAVGESYSPDPDRA